MLFSAVITLMTVATLCSCNRTSSSGNRTIRSDSDGVIYADRFRLESLEGYSILEITEPWQGATGIRHLYYLVKDSAVVDELPEGAVIINVPVRKMVCMSVTHVAMVAALGMEESICGVSGSSLVYNEKVSEMIGAGAVRDVGYDANLNRELIMTLNPDVVMSYGVGGETSRNMGKMAELGVTVLFNAEYLETNPLGKAEWIKVFGALFAAEQKADSVFNEAIKEYMSVKRWVEDNAETKPKVMLGLPWKDTWYISPGNSYVSKLIKDAGGQYLWEETVSQYSMPFNIENVYIKAVEADYWLNPGTASSVRDIINTDVRLGDLPVVQQGKVYNNTARLTESGGNDYWEVGTVNPGLVLKDIVTILHRDNGYRDMTFFKHIR